MGLAFGLCAHALKLHAANPSGHGQDEERRMGERWGEKGGMRERREGAESNSGGGGPQATLVDGEPPPPVRHLHLPPSLPLFFYPLYHQITYVK